MGVAVVGATFENRLRHGGMGVARPRNPALARQDVLDRSLPGPLVTDIVGLYLDHPKHGLASGSQYRNLRGPLSVTTRRRRGQPSFPRQYQRNSATIGSPTASFAALLVLMSRETSQPIPTATAPEKQSGILPTNSPSHPHQPAPLRCGGQTLCAGWAMNRLVHATCRLR